MNTAEMWMKAQNDGCVYECSKYRMLYSKNTGLVDNEDDYYNTTVYLEDFSGTTIDELMQAEWKYADNVMTIEEAEKKFGIRIIQN